MNKALGLPTEDFQNFTPGQSRDVIERKTMSTYC